MAQTLELINSRYKVTRILHAEPDYAALQAVDIESREKTEYLLNVYEGALGRRYADCFDRLQYCPEYMEMFLTDGALVAVFKLDTSADIDAFFYKGADIPLETRVSYAGALFHLALCVFNYPPEISCAVLFSQNLHVRPTDKGFAANYIIAPIDGLQAGPNHREFFYLLYDQVKKIFLLRFDSEDAEIELLEDMRQALERGGNISMSALYAHWLDIGEEMLAQSEKTAAMNPVERFGHFAFLCLKRGYRHIRAKGERL